MCPTGHILDRGLQKSWSEVPLRMKRLLDKADPSHMRKIAPSEIEHINELHLGIRRAARRALKDAIEIGAWFLGRQGEIAAGEKRGTWSHWLEENFPKSHVASVYRYMELARAASAKLISSGARIQYYNVEDIQVWLGLVGRVNVVRILTTFYFAVRNCR
jgi:hypothetical protein